MALRALGAAPRSGGSGGDVRRGRRRDRARLRRGRSTRDIDAVFEPKMEIYAAAAELAERLGLPPGWLNDAVKGFIGGTDPNASPVLDVPGLRCLAASPRVLLALKVLAHRVGEDEADVLLLADALGLPTAEKVLALAEEVFGDRPEPAARFFVEELFA
ncbi:MAG: hypothetical protein WKF31_13075 [Thermoleophilaceae bacterium]